MTAPRSLFAAVAAAVLAAPAAAADPVVIDLPERVTVRTAVVTIGTVARLAGGDAAARDQIAQLDLAEVRAREPTLTLTRQVIAFRLRLAGIDPAGVVMAGADRVTIVAARRTVTTDEVAAAVRAELVRRMTYPPEAVVVELALPIVVPLPAVPEAEPVTITAVPHSRPVVAPGRVQMDVAIYGGGEKLLSLAVYMAVRMVDPVGRPALAQAGYVGAAPAAVTPAGGVTPPPPPAAAGGKPGGPGEILIRPHERVTMVVRLGAVEVSAVGEALQEGRLGQSIQLQNVDSKKTVTGRVVGPATVAVDLGGVP